MKSYANICKSHSLKIKPYTWDNFENIFHSYI